MTKNAIIILIFVFLLFIFANSQTCGEIVRACGTYNASPYGSLIFKEPNKMIKICSICECEFDINSTEKKKAGGFINHCPQCSNEENPKYLGVASADGKFNQISILKFESKEDRQKYANYWKNNSGLNKSKSCQLGKHLSTDPNIKFKSIQSFSPTNHKGKQ